MVEKNNSSQKRKLLISGAIVLMVAAIVLLAIATLRPQLQKYRITGCRGCGPVCGTNLSGLTKAIAIYVADFERGYPTPDKWCDLLVQGNYATKRQFVCPDARRKGDNGPSHYAINPNATPTSDPNVVLLFDTKPGWNQFGGPELLAIHEHHDGEEYNIAFVNGRVKVYVGKKQLGNLKWK
jgi:hypothetical protein